MEKSYFDLYNDYLDMEDKVREKTSGFIKDNLDKFENKTIEFDCNEYSTIYVRSKKKYKEIKKVMNCGKGMVMVFFTDCDWTYTCILDIHALVVLANAIEAKLECKETKVI
jgi:alkyl hydroperoxide reductase subunit AhpC